MAEASISGSLTREDVTDVAGFVNAANVPKAAGQCKSVYCGFWIRFFFAIGFDPEDNEGRAFSCRSGSA